MATTRLDRHLYVLGDPSAHVGFLNCERIAERSHIHGWSVEPHYHDGLAQLFVFDEGEVGARIDYAPRAISGPALVWLPALCSHAFEYQAGMRGWVITVPAVDTARIASESALCARWIGKPQLLTGPEHRQRLTEAIALAERIEAEHRQSGEERNRALEAWFRLVLILIGRGLAATEPARDGVSDRKLQLVARFHALVEEVRPNALSVSQAASALSVTPTQLSRTVKAVTGRTAGALIAEHTLLLCKRRLAFTDQPVAGLAFDLGFSSPSYFTRFFAAHVHETPRAFRQRIRRTA